MLRTQKIASPTVRGADSSPVDSQQKKPDMQARTGTSSVAPEIARLKERSPSPTQNEGSSSRGGATFGTSTPGAKGRHEASTSTLHSKPLPPLPQGATANSTTHGADRLANPTRPLRPTRPSPLPTIAEEPDIAAPVSGNDTRPPRPTRPLPLPPRDAQQGVQTLAQQHVPVRTTGGDTRESHPLPLPPGATQQHTTGTALPTNNRTRPQVPKGPRPQPPAHKQGIAGPSTARPSAPSQPPSRPPSIKVEAAPEENAAPEDPGFQMPAKRQRLGQPVDRDKPGFSLLETNKLRPDASVAAAVGISTHTTPGAAAGAVVGGSMTAAHEALGAVVNGHAFFAASERKKRYGTQLDSMLKDDLGKFEAKRASGEPIHPDTMIFKRKNAIKKVGDLHNAGAPGNKPVALEYDMEAVQKLATSDDPALKNESAHAKNVLLTAFLKDDVAAKQRNRAAYEFIRNSVAISAATATAIGTHGASVAVAGSHAAGVAAGQRIAGSAFSGASSLDVAKGIRGLKQRMRNDKAEVVGSYELQKRQAFAERYAGPNATADDKKIISDLGDASDKVIKDTHLAFREQARTQAGKETFGKIFPGSLINDKKSTAAKKEKRDVVGKHAYAVVDYHMGTSDPVKSEQHAEQWNEIMNTPNGTRKSRQKQFAAMIDKDPGMKTAYQLLRDTGMGRGESIYTMQRMIEMSVETKMAKNPEMNKLGGSPDFAKDDAAQKATTSRLTTAFARR
jgi:hypothetical protein